MEDPKHYLWNLRCTFSFPAALWVVLGCAFRFCSQKWSVDGTLTRFVWFDTMISLYLPCVIPNKMRNYETDQTTCWSCKRIHAQLVQTPPSKDDFRKTQVCAGLVPPSYPEIDMYSDSPRNSPQLWQTDLSENTAIERYSFKWFISTLHPLIDETTKEHHTTAYHSHYIQ